MKISFSVPKSVILFAVLALLLSIFIYKSNSTLLASNLILAPETQISSSNSDTALSGSQIEWLSMVSRVKKGFLKNLFITSVIKGKVVNINQNEGKIGDLKQYYSGEKGYYVYNGSIDLETTERKRQTIFFSKRRMDMMKVIKEGGDLVKEVKFASIKKGDNIEVEESLDLAKDNIDDANVLYLTIRILSK